MSQRVARLFDNLEGKLDAEKIERLRTSFEASLKTWEEAGLFSEERKNSGYKRPDFEEDYLSLFGAEDLDMMEEGSELDKGYGRVVWAPYDVPIASEDAEKLTYMKLLEKALKEAFQSTIGGKPANTLRVGPDKRVLTADQIDFEKILWQLERYAKPGIVHNPQKLDLIGHGGKTDDQLRTSLQGKEKETCGRLRFERDQLIMARDIGREKMSGRDWHQIFKESKILPMQLKEAQDARQAFAYYLHCLTTEGWIPEYYDFQELAKSQVALAPATYLPDESSAGAVPALGFDTNDKQFNAGGNLADLQYYYYGARGGVRKNNVAA